MSHTPPPLQSLIAQTAAQALHELPVDAQLDSRIATPAARILLDQPPGSAWQQAAQQLVAWLDSDVAAGGLRSPGPVGIRRPVYTPLVMHLLLRTAPPLAHTPTTLLAQHATRALKSSSANIALALWHALCILQYDAHIAILERAVVSHALDRVAAVLAHHEEPLHPLAHDQPLDFWTFEELSAIHALWHLAELVDRDDWRARLDQALHYHQAHTQPDYTTYEPWGLGAFAQQPATRWFAEQQLHDATTHLHLSRTLTSSAPDTTIATGAARGGEWGQWGGGGVIGLLLADAAAGPLGARAI